MVVLFSQYKLRMVGSGSLQTHSSLECRLHTDSLTVTVGRCIDERLLPVQLYLKGDTMVNILQHISHCGIRSVCHTGQRHRVPLAHLDQT